MRRRRQKRNILSAPWRSFRILVQLLRDAQRQADSYSRAGFFFRLRRRRCRGPEQKGSVDKVKEEDSAFRFV